MSDTMFSFCDECKMQLDSPDEYHPHLFCVLYKAYGKPPEELLRSYNFVPVPNDIALAFKIMHTISRADGEMIGGEFAHFQAAGPEDWQLAQDEATGECARIEFAMDTWVRVKTENRWFGDEPEDEEDDG